MTFMKRKKIELDVDSIGSQETLTQAEEKALTDYFKKRKLVAQNRQTKASSKNLLRSKSTIE
jgi:hypothetical protein